MKSIIIYSKYEMLDGKKYLADMLSIARINHGLSLSNVSCLSDIKVPLLT